jgi:hypothetical protein
MAVKVENVKTNTNIVFVIALPITFCGLAQLALAKRLIVELR